MLSLLNSLSIWVLLILCAIAMLGKNRDTRPWSIGWTYVVFIVIWLSLYLADTLEHAIYTTGTVTARWLFVLSVYLVNRYVKRVTTAEEAQQAEIMALKAANKLLIQQLKQKGHGAL